MRNLFISVVILFLLAACGASTPAPTVTSTPTSTPTATLTPLPTLTPTVTFTPAPAFPPEVVDAIEAAWTGATVDAKGIKLADGTYPSGLTPTEDGRVTVDGYDFTTQYGETIHMPEITYNLTDFSFNSQNQFCRPAHCWDAEAGAWVRAIESFPALEGGTVELEVFSNEEVNAEIAATAKDATPEEKEASNKIAHNILNELFGRNFFGTRTPLYTFAGMLMPSRDGYCFGDNELKIEDKQTGKLNIVETSFYVVRAIGKSDEYALVGWRSGGEDFVRIVDKVKLNVPANFNPLFEERAPKE